MSWTPSYDGAALDDSTGVAVKAIKDKPMVKVKTAELLGDGVAVERYSKSGRHITLSGTIIGQSQSNLDARVNSRVESFTNPSGGILTLESSREIFVYPKIGSLELIKGSSNLAIDFSVEFYSESPYWRGTTVQTKTLSLSSSGSNTSVATITNSGSAPVRPLIQITQKSGTSGVRDPLTLSIGNITIESPEYIRLTGAALGNDIDTIVLDSTDESVYLINDTSSSTKVPKRVDGAFFRLESGDNKVFLDAHTTGGNLTVSLVYKNNYYSSGF